MYVEIIQSYERHQATQRGVFVVREFLITPSWNVMERAWFAHNYDISEHEEKSQINVFSSLVNRWAPVHPSGPTDMLSTQREPTNSLMRSRLVPHLNAQTQTVMHHINMEKCWGEGVPVKVLWDIKGDICKPVWPETLWCAPGVCSSHWTRSSPACLREVSPSQQKLVRESQTCTPGLRCLDGANSTRTTMKNMNHTLLSRIKSHNKDEPQMRSP